MAESARAPGDWSWLEESDLRLCCALIFARDVDEDEMFAAFGLDPASARNEPWVLDPHHRRVRVGRSGSWTFAIDEEMLSLDLAIHGKNVAKRLSPGIEVVVITSTAKPTESFEYWADGIQVTLFEPYRACDRVGSDPDRFLREMQQLGMVTEPDDDAEGPADDLAAALDLATVALGIWLPDPATMGPLATVTV